jgi:hypothetical protein
MINDLPSILEDVPAISLIVKECMLVAESHLEHHPSSIMRLTPDEALAIAAYARRISTLH